MKKRFNDIKEILYKDSYLIRQYKENDFDFIIDIGANTGTFTLVSHIYFPSAKLFSYEPCIDAFEMMTENMGGFKNICLFNMALGNGSPLNFKCVGDPVCTGNQFVEEDNGTYSIKSVTLTDIFRTNNIDINKNTLLKIDCEGGERYLLNEECIPILQGCKHIAFEIHFKSKNKNFDCLPEWATYKDWIFNIFEKTHDILYHRSNRDRGVGVYILRKKG